MQTRRSTKPTQNIRLADSPSAVDNPASSRSHTDDSTGLIASPSTPSITQTNASNHSSTPTSNIPNTYSLTGTSPSTPSNTQTNTSSHSSTLTSNIPDTYRPTRTICDTTIEDYFGLHPRGRDAIASFPNNITNINPANYTWIKGSSNYTLCHKASGEPRQALLWFVGEIDSHSLDAATAYESWTLDVLLPTETDKALDKLLKTGPWKTFTKPNRYSILRTKAVLPRTEHHRKRSVTIHI